MLELEEVTAVFALSTFAFLFYIQFSPTMGNIWLRDGHFTPRGAFEVMIYPFREWRMWKPEMWIINYPVWISCGITAAGIFRCTLRADD